MTSHDGNRRAKGDFKVLRQIDRERKMAALPA